jgi:hypothetical protein
MRTSPAAGTTAAAVVVAAAAVAAAAVAAAKEAAPEKQARQPAAPESPQARAKIPTRRARVEAVVVVAVEADALAMAGDERPKAATGGHGFLPTHSPKADVGAVAVVAGCGGGGAVKPAHVVDACRLQSRSCCRRPSRRLHLAPRGRWALAESLLRHFYQMVDRLRACCLHHRQRRQDHMTG